MIHLWRKHGVRTPVKEEHTKMLRRYQGVKILDLQPVQEEDVEDTQQQDQAINDILNNSISNIYIQDPELPLLLSEGDTDTSDKDGEQPKEVHTPEAHKNLPHMCKDEEQPKEVNTPEAHKNLLHSTIRVVNGIWVIEKQPGEITLTEDKAELLNFQPNFQLNDKMSEVDFETEFGNVGCKLRWELMKRKQDEEDSKEGIGDEDTETVKMDEAICRKIYDEKKKMIDMSKRRVTDLESNKKVYLPKAMDYRRVAKLDVRMDNFWSTFKDYRAELCKKGPTTSLRARIASDGQV